MAFISPLDSLLSDDKITSEVSFQVSKLIVSLQYWIHRILRAARKNGSCALQWVSTDVSADFSVDCRLTDRSLYRSSVGGESVDISTDMSTGMSNDSRLRYRPIYLSIFPYKTQKKQQNNNTQQCRGLKGLTCQ